MFQTFCLRLFDFEHPFGTHSKEHITSCHGQFMYYVVTVERTVKVCIAVTSFFCVSLASRTNIHENNLLTNKMASVGEEA